MEFSAGQNDAIGKAEAWLETGGEQVFRVFGYAGTGKTTIALKLTAEVKGRVVFGAFTGKAAAVMRKAGCANATTLHSLIYIPRLDKKTGTISYEKNLDGPVAEAALVVVDECSMVDESLAEDLLSFGVPVLVLGDPAQLPPPKGAGYFTNVEDPDVMLTEIHRQAENSAIIHMATKVRQGEALDFGDYGVCKVISRNSIDRDRLKLLATGADQVLVGTNKTRAGYNGSLRAAAGKSGDYPEVGDRLVCRKNDHALGIYNGGSFIAGERLKIKKHSRTCVSFNVTPIDTDSEIVIPVLCRKECFVGGYEDLHWRETRGTNKFEFGYALTVHMSQGSQWDDVFIKDESFVFGENRNRHLYTAITRAATRVTVVR